MTPDDALRQWNTISLDLTLCFLLDQKKTPIVVINEQAY